MRNGDLYNFVRDKNRVIGYFCRRICTSNTSSSYKRQWNGTCSKLIDSVASRGVNMILNSLFHGPWSCLFKLCTKEGRACISHRDGSFEPVLVWLLFMLSDTTLLSFPRTSLSRATSYATNQRQKDRYQMNYRVPFLHESFHKFKRRKHDTRSTLK